MLTPENTFKTAMTQGRQQIVLWLALADAYSAELCAASGFDCLVIDAEHAPNDLQSILASLQSIAAYPVEAVVRLPNNKADLIKQVLDLGASSLVIPMVETAEEARALVSATRYPPQGIRGVGSGLARSSRWTRYEDYLDVANERICLILQVETQSALNNVEEIAAVEGVDGVFIGPADLAASMGLRGSTSHPKVKSAVEGAIRKIRAVGKSAGVLCVEESLAKHYLAVGSNLLAVGVDTSLLADAAASLVQRFNDSKIKT